MPITMNTSTMTPLIEPGDLVYVRGRYPVFLVISVRQEQALVSDVVEARVGANGRRPSGGGPRLRARHKKS
jgi:hypothetical protein